MYDGKRFYVRSHYGPPRFRRFSRHSSVRQFVRKQVKTYEIILLSYYVIRTTDGPVRSAKCREYSINYTYIMCIRAHGPTLGPARLNKHVDNNNIYVRKKKMQAQGRGNFPFRRRHANDPFTPTPASNVHFHWARSRSLGPFHHRYYTTIRGTISCDLVLQQNPRTIYIQTVF